LFLARGELQAVMRGNQDQQDEVFSYRLNDKEREHPQFALSQKKRRLIEKVFSWIKMVAGLRKTKLRGRRRVEWVFRLAAAAYNLVRMTKLIPAV
jgi:hypothetical protein